MDSMSLPYRDTRVDQIIEDPAGYFAAASARAYVQARRIVEADLHRLQLNGYRPIRDGSEDDEQ
ncbi:MAG: hypothetical protein GEU83_01030 [Pseudonocardiaceae bacterium]|nr:hypothetical protein [Pseudonocardiaceae bacterium]